MGKHGGDDGKRKPGSVHQTTRRTAKDFMPNSVGERRGGARRGGETTGGNGGAGSYAANELGDTSGGHIETGK